MKDYQDDTAWIVVTDELGRLEDAYLRAIAKAGADKRVPGLGVKDVWTPQQFADILGLSQGTANRYAQLCEENEPKCVVITTGENAKEKGRRYFKANYFRHAYALYAWRKAYRMLTGPHWQKFYRRDSDGTVNGRLNKHVRPRKPR